MRKIKGAALATAVMLCTFLLIITFGVTSLVIQTANLNRASEITRDQKVAFIEASERYYHSKGTDDVSTYSYSSLTFRTFDKDGDPSTNVKAFCAYVGGDALRFYAVYDFNTTPGKVLAYQTSNLYIDASNKVGGLVYIGE